MTEVGEGIEVDALPDDVLETIQVIVSSEIKKEPSDELYYTIDATNPASEFFVIEEYEKPQEVIIHPSIGSDRKQFIRRLKSTGQCYLCSKKTKNVGEHFMKYHLNQMINMGGKHILLCNLGCKKAPHFHCPYPDCLYSTARKGNLKSHFAGHEQEMETGDPDLPSIKW